MTGGGCGVRTRILQPRSTTDLDDATTLIRAYIAELGVDLAFQDVARELATLPGVYAAPAGALLLARDAEGTALGCVAPRPLARAGCCEMKRLYVAPAGRGRGLGRALVEAIIGEAERIGYRRMLLDTLPSMSGARAIYRATGFTSIAAYYDTPLPGTLFLARSLAPSSAAS